MKVLLIYDSVSAARVTGNVAEAIVAELKQDGLSVDSLFVDDASKVIVNDYDCLIIGAPTMAWRPSKKMRGFLTGLGGAQFSGKMAATFDTQMKSAISGNATKHMEKSLKSLGFKIAVPSLIAYVKSENKAYSLKEGEMEKIKAWSKDAAKELLKK